jgi:hypothetical protein
VTDGLATKGEAVEEWIDLRFFRPLGSALARALAPSGVSPDQVTVWSLVTGLVAGHLFFYHDVWLNIAGWVLFIISDVFDSADGQLARMRGTSTRLGRILDGMSDNARFVNLYANLLARLVFVEHWEWMAAGALVVAAGISHSWQSTAVDCIRHAFLSIGIGEGSELELPEDQHEGGSIPARLFAAYVRRQARMFPATMTLERRRRNGLLSAPARSAYRDGTVKLLAQCSWLGQNARWILLLGAVVIGRWPAGVMWVTLVPFNVILLAIILGAERASLRALAWADATAGGSQPEPVGAD